VDSLPFTQVGRILLLPDKTWPHTDPGKADFIWGQVGDAKFYVITPEGKQYITSTLAYFDQSLTHGKDVPQPGTFSFRVDGIFQPWFRDLICN
jgi:hypothetical protein